MSYAKFYEKFFWEKFILKLIQEDRLYLLRRISSAVRTKLVSI